MMPALFIAHGAPLLAIEENEYTSFLAGLSQQFPKPKAVVVFSAHWLAEEQNISEVDHYSTIYDFGGFPDELYQINYPAFNDLEIVQEIKSLLSTQRIGYDADTVRGLDHGAWVVLRLLYPNAEVPVVAMSVNPYLSPQDQYRIGVALSSLRKKDILVIASGGTVHNLGAIRWEGNSVDEWALQFDEWLEKRLIEWDLTSLYQYRTLAPYAKFAVPTYGTEHFVPIFYAMGVAHEVQKATLLYRGYRYGSLSHSVWQFG